MAPGYDKTPNPNLNSNPNPNLKLCKAPEINKAVLTKMNEIAKAKLAPNEKLKAVHLISGTGSATVGSATSPWTPENGYMTASNKLDRNAIKLGKGESASLSNVLEPMRKMAGASDILK